MVLKAYGAALSGWLLGGIAPPVVTVITLVVAVNAACGGGSDCSWGFEVILALPVLVGAFFGTGPALVRRLVSRSIDLSAGRRAARSTRWAAAGSIVALYLAGGSDLRGFYVMLVLVSVGVPAVVAWRLDHADEAASPN